MRLASLVRSLSRSFVVSFVRCLARSSQLQIDLHSDSKADHHVLRETIHGKHRGSQYSLKTLYAMLEEVVELKVLLFVAYRLLTHLVFWEYPPHSAACLFVCYRVCVNPDLIPAFVAFLLFTALLATNLYQQRNHCRWRRPRLFHHCIAILVLDRDDYFTTEHVAPGDNVAAQEAADRDWEIEQEEFWVMMTQGEERSDELTKTCAIERHTTVTRFARC